VLSRACHVSRSGSGARKKNSLVVVDAPVVEVVGVDRAIASDGVSGRAKTRCGIANVVASIAPAGTFSSGAPRLTMSAITSLA
jgi:hypothetical protein